LAIHSNFRLLFASFFDFYTASIFWPKISTFFSIGLQTTRSVAKWIFCVCVCHGISRVSPPLIHSLGKAALFAGCLPPSLSIPEASLKMLPTPASKSHNGPLTLCRQIYNTAMTFLGGKKKNVEEARKMRPDDTLLLKGWHGTGREAR
jgi:hypothetical protein